MKAYGNVFAGQAFWIGMAREEVPRRKLDTHDENFPIVVCVKAVKEQ